MLCSDIPKAWYDKATGMFYLNEDHLPEAGIKRGSIVPLFEKLAEPTIEEKVD